MRKQVFRIAAGGDSLWVRSVRSKYKFTSWNNASFVCSDSRMWRRLVKAGLAAAANISVAIANENTTLLYYDNWLDGSPLPATLGGLTEGAKVTSFITDGQWDIELIKAVLGEEWLQPILNVQINLEAEKDVAVWGDTFLLSPRVRDLMLQPTPVLDSLVSGSVFVVKRKLSASNWRFA